MKQEAFRERIPPPRLVWGAQVSQAWNSLANSFLCPYPEKNHEYSSIFYSMMLVTNTDTENRKMNPVSNGFNASPRNVSACSSGQNGPILKISWKSVLPFHRNVAQRHADAPRWETVKQSSQSWNSLDHFFLCRAWRMAISWKFVHPLFHNVTKTTDPKNRKIDPGLKGFITRSRKCSRVFLDEP